MNADKVLGKVYGFLVYFDFFSFLVLGRSFRDQNFWNFGNLGISILESVFRVQQFSFSSIKFKFILNVLLCFHFYEIISVLVFRYVHSEYVWNDITDVSDGYFWIVKCWHLNWFFLCSFLHVFNFYLIFI